MSRGLHVTAAAGSRPADSTEPADVEQAAAAPEPALTRPEPGLDPAALAAAPALPQPASAAAEPALAEPALAGAALAEPTAAESAPAESADPEAGVIPAAASAAGRPRRSPGPSWLLVCAGALTLVIAVLTVASLYLTFAPDYRLLSYSTNIEQTLLNGALSLAAGICLLVPRTSRRIGTGLGLGAAATLPADAASIRLSLKISSPPGPGAWLVIVALILALVSVVLIAVHLARTREIRVEPRSLASGPAAWLIVLLGATGAIAYLAQLAGRHDIVGFGQVYVNHELLAGLIWVTLMALVIPFLAVAARPRSFGVALAAGWVGAGLAEVIFLTGLKTSVFGYTLIAIAVLLVPLARTAPAAEVAPGEPTVTS